MRWSRRSGRARAADSGWTSWSTIPTAGCKVDSSGRRNTSMVGVSDGDDAGAAAREVQLYRGQVPSPGRPTVAWRDDRVRFWAAVARGLKTEDAASEAGVSSPGAVRGVRHAGGGNPFLSPKVSGRYLSFVEREGIALLRAQDLGVREIARRLSRSPSTISRELRRNASTRTWRLAYKASTAQWHVERRARRPKVVKLIRD